MSRTLIKLLKNEKSDQIKGGIYNKLQVDFAYNSNHIEGSKLSHEQTRYIFETQTVGNEPVKVNDIIETVNHFRCFDYIIDTYDSEITEGYVKTLHKILKNGTYSSYNDDAVVGDYKQYPNEVGEIETTLPESVSSEMKKLLNRYYENNNTTLYKILEFHVLFEKIHPFYDGNGRVGRLLMFKECLKNDIVPFVIKDEDKYFYYNGLKNWQTKNDKGYFIDTCLMTQDSMKLVLDYFRVDYDRTEIKCSDVIRQSEQPDIIPPSRSRGR